MPQFNVSDKPIGTSNSGTRQYGISGYMGCGNGYKNKRYIKLTSSKEDIDLYEEVLRALRLKVTRLSPTSIVYDRGRNVNKGILAFRIGRYFRNAQLRELVVTMIDMYKSGIPFYIALPAAHISMTNPNGYNNSMDVYYRTNTVRLFNTRQEFERRLKLDKDRSYIKPRDDKERNSTLLSNIHKCRRDRQYRKLIKLL